MPQIIPAITAVVGAVASVAATATFAITGSGVLAAAVASGIMASQGFLVTVALKFAAKKLLTGSASKQALDSRQADVLQLTLGESPRSCILGRARVSGSLVDAFNFGNNNEWECMVIAFADHRCHQLEGVWINDTFYPWNDDPHLGGTIRGDKGEPAVTMTWRDGRPGQDLDDLLTSFGAPFWGAEDVMTGVAHITFCYKFSQKAWPSGRPSISALIRGAYLYNPAKDSTVPGGSGSHRWNDQSTWEWTENAYVARYNYVRGIWTNGQLLIGPGRTAEEAPPELAIPGIAACAEGVWRKDGSGEPRYRVSAVIDANESWFEIEQHFAAAMAGDIVESQGAISIDVGVAKTPVATITDDDLLLDMPCETQARVSRKDRVNTVTPTFVDIEKMWTASSGAVRRSQADIDEDGEPRDMPLALRFVHTQTQAQRIAEISRRKARLMRSATITLGPRYCMLEVGDWIVWNSSRYNGGVSRTFMIVGTSIDEFFRMTLTLKEISAYAYEFNPAVDELDPQAASFLPQAIPAPLTISGFTPTAFADYDALGNPRVKVRVTWTDIDEAALNGIWAEIREVGSLVVQRTFFPYGALPAPDAAVLIADLSFSADYEVRLVPDVQAGRDSQATAWQEVRTSDPIAPAVTGLAATASPDGATLIWDIIARPDIIGYEVRVGVAVSTPWAEADVVASRVTAPPFFAEIETPDPVFFQVRAVTGTGALSGVSAIVSAQVTPPGNVPEFNVYPTGQTVRFTWAEPSANLIYEIRAGADWNTARLVTESTGGGAIVLWPIRNDIDGLFWIKARSAAGLYSAQAYLASARPAPLSDRNIVLDADFAEDDWPGVVHNMTRDGGFLTLDKVGGVTVASGDYYGSITLPATFTARAWIEQRLNALLGGDPTWADLGDLTWAELGDMTWDPPLSDAGTARCTPYIAVNTAPDDSIVDAWRFAANDTSVRSVAPTLSVNVTRAECWTSLGAHIPLTARLVVPVSAAAEYGAILTARYESALTEETVIATFYGGGDWLQIIADPTDGTVSLLDSNGARIDLEFMIDAGDPVKFGIDQSADARSFFVASRLKTTPVFATAAHAPLAAPDYIELAGAGLGAKVTWADASFAWNSQQGKYPWKAQYHPLGDVTHREPATFENLKVQTIGLTLDLFTSELTRGAPVGFEPFRPFQPGDYKLSEAIIWLHVEAPDRASVTISLTQATVVVDVPDILDSGDAEIDAEVTRITFKRPFNIIPEVTTGHLGGIGVAPVHFKVIEGSIDLTGFEVVGALLSSPSTPAGGKLAYIAKGA